MAENPFRRAGVSIDDLSDALAGLEGPAYRASEIRSMLIAAWYHGYGCVVHVVAENIEHPDAVDELLRIEGLRGPGDLGVDLRRFATGRPS